MRVAAVVLFVFLTASAAFLSTGRTTTLAQGATPASGATADCPATTAEENEALVRRWYEEVWNQRDMDVLDDILAEDYVRYRAGIPFANETGTDDDRQWVEMILAEFPDVSFSIEDILADGEGGRAHDHLWHADGADGRYGECPGLRATDDAREHRDLARGLRQTGGAVDRAGQPRHVAPARGRH